MKAIKLILLFAVILVGVVAAFFFGTGGTIADLWPKSKPDNIQKLVAEFEDDWKAAGDWNEKVFTEHCEMIQQMSVKYDTKALQDLNTETAVRLVTEKIFAEWKKPSCSKAVVDKYYHAIGVIESKDNNAAANPDFKTIKSVYATYKEIIAFVNTRIGLSPGFNGSGWNSYSNYSTSIKNKVSAYKSNANYNAYLSGITALSIGLNAIPEKVDAGRASFYSSLAQSIISHFEHRERTEGNYNQLVSVRNKYNSEYSSNGNLNSFVNRFHQEWIDQYM